MKKKLLLSSVCRPFGSKFGDSFFTSYDCGWQIGWAQGIFRSFGTTKTTGIDFIAENLDMPTTTLHYPTMRQFIKEIKKGYDYIGIAFIEATTHKMVPMAEAIRKYAPRSKIILGCYGTVLPDEKLKPYSDYICRSEGIRFMRELLGEPLDKEIRQPIITERRYITLIPRPPEAYIIGSLGCPNGCDFCLSSHYYKRKKEMFLPDGKSILNAIKRLRVSYPGMTDFWMHDEDFLLNRKRAIQFLEEIRKSDLPPLSIFVLGSVKALSQFEPSELVEMGIGYITIGYEGQRAGYKKMEGRSYKDLFKDLKAHGIGVLATAIIGFDYQTPEIIDEEFSDLMSLRPDMCQFAIYTPYVGTPLYERLEAEGRLLPDIVEDTSKHDASWLIFKHPHIDQETMRRKQKDLYRMEYELLGPTLFRCIENHLNGYVNLRNHPSPRVRAKAQVYKELARWAVPLIPASKRYQNERVNEWLDDLRKRVVAETGDIKLRESFVSKFIPILYKAMDLKLRYNIGMQPKFTRRTYRM